MVALKGKRDFITPRMAWQILLGLSLTVYPISIKGIEQLVPNNQLM